MKVNQHAFDIGQLAQRLSSGYCTHLAAITVACNPHAGILAPERLPGDRIPIGTVKRKDGTEHQFHFLHYLKEASNDKIVSEELERVWLSGSLLRLGDALAIHNYFDRAPELELVRHLRNGIAHGNRFRIDNPSGLKKFPAHNRLALSRSSLKTDFEISPRLNGTKVLFDFMEAGDVLDVLTSVAMYLIRMGNGESLRT